MVLTTKRTGETRFAEGAFFSRGVSVRTTPEGLVKMRHAHRVPISRQALVVLDSMQALNGDRRHVSSKPRNRSGVICEIAAHLLVQRFDPAITRHEFRAAFKTWARGRRVYSPDAITFAVAHEPAKLEAAYQRADLLEDRAELMQDREDFVPSGEAPHRLLDRHAMAGAAV